MLSIGFWELAVIGVVLLIVVGPERLPGVLREGSRWLGMMRRTAREAQYQIEDELAKMDLERPRGPQSMEKYLLDPDQQRRGAMQARDEADSGQHEEDAPLDQAGVDSDIDLATADDGQAAPGDSAGNSSSENPAAGST